MEKEEKEELSKTLEILTTKIKDKNGDSEDSTKEKSKEEKIYDNFISGM